MTPHDRSIQAEFLGACPLPFKQYDRVLLGHGSGGQLTAELIHGLFLPTFESAILSGLEDAAVLALEGPRIAFTTDSFVVRPLFFPGGDIGTLAVNGTVNDLAMSGARPLFLSVAFILEEGLPLEDLKRIARSISEASRAAGAVLVTGDTKVVDRGKGDQVFITTSGIGLVPEGVSLSVRSVQPGDHVLVSGTIGDHGIAIMSVREGLEFETVLESDTAPLADLAQVMIEAAPGLRWMRDPTRGGVSSSLNELASVARVGVRLDESAIPIRDEVRGACELLGLDPLYVANEGKLLAVVAREDSERLLAAMRSHPLGTRASVIGEIVADHPGLVAMRSVIGSERVVSMLSGEQLPRIC